MPLHFEPPMEQPYFTTRFIGLITDVELLDYYNSVYSRPENQPLTAELADLSEADLSGVSSTGLTLVAKTVEERLLELGIEAHKSAIFAPERVLYGMGRAYEGWARSSVEEVRIFTDREQAIEWLCA